VPAELLARKAAAAYSSAMEIYNIIDQRQHLETITRWHHHEWAAMNVGRSFESRLADMQAHLAGNSVPATWIALIDGQPAGSASILDDDMPERPELKPWLASVFTHPDFRHRGIGRALVQRVMDHARDSGFSTLYLYTPDKAHFYAQLDWESFEVLPYHGSTVTLMSWKCN